VFCPKCGDEFREGVDFCPDCHVSLTTRPVAEVVSAFEPVFIARDEPELAIVKGFLQSLDIPFITGGDPAELFGSSVKEGGTPMEILVPKEHAARAKMEIAKRQSRHGVV
jgi:hypothetical protein